MTLNLITLDTVKTHLGIGNEDYDSAITAMVPVVSADVRRIMNCEYAEMIFVDITSGSTEFTSNIELKMGDVLSGTGITSDSYVTDYDYDSDKYTMTNPATSDSDFIYRTINIAMWPAISKMIWYRISKKTTTGIGAKNLQARTIGPLSETFAQSEINSQYDYPQRLIDDLGVPYVVVG